MQGYLSHSYVIGEILGCPGSTELLGFILHIPDKFLTNDRLLKATLGINLTRREVDRLIKKAELASIATGLTK
jgi:hypothetical protein